VSAPAVREAIELLVVAPAQNNAERLNSALRNAGHAVRPVWVADAMACETTLTQRRPDLIFCFLANAAAELDEVVELRDRLAPGVPLIAVAKGIDEPAIAAAMAQGARDLVSGDHAARLVAVALRELAVAADAKRLQAAEETIRGNASRFETLLTESNDAIAYVQDGIITEVNPAFVERFAYSSTDDLVGNPIMDLFEGASQTLLKDALRATLKGKDAGEIALNGIAQDGGPIAAKALLRAVEMDGEPSVEIAIRAEVDTKAMEEKIAEVSRRDALTGLYLRHYFVEVLNEELVREERSAARALLYIKPDKFSVVEERVGLLASDDVLKRLGELIAENLADSDLASRFGGNIYTALVTRNNFKEIEAIAERLRDAVSKTVFQAGAGSTSMTISIGIADLNAPAKGPGGLIAFAQQAIDEARKAGGNRFKVWAPAEVDKTGQVTDAGWVKRITQALRENRFHLAYQGIASLQGDATDMIDVLVRMIGDDGADIMPAEFMPAAARNNLMVGIDRWIVVNALKVALERAKTREGTRLFLRISDQTLVDPLFPPFLAKGLAEMKVPKGSIVVQVAEKSVAKFLNETKNLARSLQQLDCAFAIEHFGIGHEPLRLLDHFKPDFVKIDGSYMQVVERDPAKREEMKSLIGAAKEKGIQTIVERVETANAMAMLWQLGADYIQGNYVQEPEVIIADGK
jgi:diguanylate cyclase (GGDEF)-like protein/PAS domain S-box-containing protein